MPLPAVGDGLRHCVF